MMIEWRQCARRKAMQHCLRDGSDLGHSAASRWCRDRSRFWRRKFPSNVSGFNMLDVVDGRGDPRSKTLVILSKPFARATDRCSAQSTVTTGISTLGKMSVGVRRMTVIPRMRISRERTTKVYGLRSARRTIHMGIPSRGGRLKLIESGGSNNRLSIILRIHEKQVARGTSYSKWGRLGEAKSQLSG